MKPEYLYAILDAQGACWRLAGGGTVKVILADLLQEGWQPLRETPFAPAEGAGSILLVLERDAEGKFGFGFTPS